jgi:ferredoxin-thioredoxin reductase catalytic subunit
LKDQLHLLKSFLKNKKFFGYPSCPNFRINLFLGHSS